MTISPMNTSPSPEPSLHAHQALAFIAGRPQGFSREELPRAIQLAFGPEARFHACTASGMDAEALVGFLLERGKLVLQGGLLHPNLADLCQHE